MGKEQFGDRVRNETNNDNKVSSELGVKAVSLSSAEAPVQTIEYPYFPEGEGAQILYVSRDHEMMQLAKAFAQENSLDKVMPNCSVVVKDGKVIGIGANGSDFHENNVCERIALGSKTGQDYDKCEGCHPKNHGEQQAITDTLQRLTPEQIEGAEIYLWGHWWLCEPCWSTMLQNGIKTTYLLEDSQTLFNKEHPDNIVGNQFE
jgi:deoxycytidylate deaminase